MTVSISRPTSSLPGNGTKDSSRASSSTIDRRIWASSADSAVVLLDPDGPISARISPGRTSSVRWSSTTVPR